VSAKEPLPPEVGGIYMGIKNHTEVHDRILSTNEVSFAINAMTGRELLVSRRAHNEPFVDFDKRELAAAVILYGNDLEEKKRLIEEYGVDYVYEDYYWAQGEFYFDASGRMTGLFDPLLVLDTPANRAYLDINGVKYAPMTTWIDPSVRGVNVRLYNLLVVTPDNYENTGKGPWKNDLDGILTLEWEYDYAGQPIAMLYRINAS
jgi:hypothetical protein